MRKRAVCVLVEKTRLRSFVMFSLYTRKLLFSAFVRSIWLLIKRLLFVSLIYSFMISRSSPKFRALHTGEDVKMKQTDFDNTEKLIRKSHQILRETEMIWASWTLDNNYCTEITNRNKIQMYLFRAGAHGCTKHLCRVNLCIIFVHVFIVTPCTFINIMIIGLKV